MNVENRRVPAGWYLVAVFSVDISLSFSVKMSAGKIQGLCFLGC